MYACSVIVTGTDTRSLVKISWHFRLGIYVLFSLNCLLIVCWLEGPDGIAVSSAVLSGASAE